MVYDCEVQCPYCGESFWLGVDLSEGENQQWIWDCEVCCQPINVHANWQSEEETFACTADRAQ
ncbi:MAG: CPXCG motif-containing cysteine-rich protein [Bdellovibrionales bacterium]|nr:CPXCG motif-containing cysteine-rich protein [Bdellovibrionales bacterium]